MSFEGLIRPASAGDVAGFVPLAGGRERVDARLRAAEAGDESMFVAVLGGGTAGVVSIRWAGECDPPHPWLYGEACHALARDRGAGHMSLDVDVDDGRARGFYEALGYGVVRPHRHRWRSVDWRTGKVVAEGTASTLILRRALTPIA